MTEHFRDSHTIGTWETGALVTTGGFDISDAYVLFLPTLAIHLEQSNKWTMPSVSLVRHYLHTFSNLFG